MASTAAAVADTSNAPVTEAERERLRAEWKAEGLHFSEMELWELDEMVVAARERWSKTDTK
jgi:hypothetical protein